IMGTLLYLIEGSGSDVSQFQNIPTSIYWAIVTITTVGYGDITPDTPVGKFLSAIIMIVGYAILAVPTGIVGAELSREMSVGNRECQSCGSGGHFRSARFCRDCGSELPPGS
ncbi:MAG: potassium channel family protein, partial [Verrucomicrobiota bacterium]